MTAPSDTTTTGSAPGSARISELDGLRGLAAVAVYLSHGFSAFFPLVMGGKSEGPMPLLRELAATYPIGWMFNGTYAVIIFFCLSGLVMTRGLFGPGGAARCPEVIARRWFRLAPMVAAGTLLAYAVLELRWVFLADLHALNGLTALDAYEPRALSDPQLRTAVRQIVWDVWVGGTYLYDIPLWTIGTEFKCSVIVVLLVALFLPLRSRRLSWLLVTWVGLLLCGDLFLCFAAGGVLAEMHARGAVPPRFRSAAVLWGLLGFGLLIGSTHPDFSKPDWIWFGDLGLGPWSGYIRTVTYTFGSTALLLCALYLPPVTRILRSGVVHFLGFVSYGVYVFHEPIVHSLGIFVCTRWAGRVGYANAGVAAIFISFVACLALAYAMVRWLDVPLNRLTARWMSRLLVRRPIG